MDSPEGIRVNTLYHHVNNFCRENIHRLIIPCKHRVFSEATEWNRGGRGRGRGRGEGERGGEVRHN
jgi:hypothetical protein